MRKCVANAFGLLLAGGTLWAQQYLITTVAGNGTAGYSGDGGPATNAQLNPHGVATDASGNLYIGDNANFVIRKVAAATGVITTVAGNGTAGYSGDGGPATSAQLSPTAVAVDGPGNIYIADSAHNVIRKVAVATGIITTVAGNGTAEFSGDGGQAVNAELNGPNALAMDAAGDLYIVDWNNKRIRQVAAATGVITTVAALDFYASAIAVDAAGDLYLAGAV